MENRIISLHRAEFAGRGMLADRQQRLDSMLHKIIRLAEIFNIAVVITNHVEDAPDTFFEDPTKAAGGNIVAHSSTYRIYLVKSGENRVAKMMGSPYHPYSDTGFTINQKGADDIEEEGHTTITSATDGNGNPVQNGSSTNSTSITFQVTATAGSNPIAGFRCSGSAFGNCPTSPTTDPATFSYGPGIFARGKQHTFAVFAVDTSSAQGLGDPNPATFSWTIGAAQAPTQTTITSAIDGNGNPVQNLGPGTFSNSITFKFTATAGTFAIACFQCSLDSPPPANFSPCNTFSSQTYDNLAAGSGMGRLHVFQVRAVDTEGNTDPNPAAFHWYVLIQPPTHTTITSATDGNGNPVQNGSSTVSTSIKFQVTATPGSNLLAGFECSLDGSSFSTCATILPNPPTISYNNLVAGQQHTFSVRAVDNQGVKDPSPVIFRWTVLTPTQAIQKLIGTIDSMNLPKGTSTSLEAPLNAAMAQLNRNNQTPACNQLNAFLNQLSAKQTSGQLTSQQAADLRQQATAIQSAIGCTNIGGMVGASVSPSLLPLPMP